MSPDAGMLATTADFTSQILAHLQKGEKALDRGEFAAALDEFQRVLDAGVALAEGCYGWGVAALRLGRTSEAVDAFPCALNVTPLHPGAGLRLAEFALADGNAAAALDLYRRVLNASPDVAEAGLRLAEMTMAEEDAARRARPL